MTDKVTLKTVIWAFTQSISKWSVWLNKKCLRGREKEREKKYETIQAEFLIFPLWVNIYIHYTDIIYIYMHIYVYIASQC